MRSSAGENPRFMFLKQTAPPHHFFLELCEDIAGDDPAVVISESKEQICKKTRYIRGPAYDRRSAARRIVSWIRFLFSATISAFRVGGKPTLFIVTQPPMLSLVGYSAI